MYQCPNCAANMQFDITRQGLCCTHCETIMDPYIAKDCHDAEESEFFETVIFTCPHCGAELFTEDNTAATFCSYCGASTLLSTRVHQQKRPQHIIPFKKTKEDCRHAYKKMVTKALYAPKELRDENHIAKFRGIYMPFWNYFFAKDGQITLKGTKKRTEGKHYVTHHYDVTCQVNAEYDGILYDATCDFYDNLSNAILPYDMREKVPFAPAFLSGFYADFGEVESQEYQEQVENLVKEDVLANIKKNTILQEYEVLESVKEKNIKETINPEKLNAELALLPVWFLSYRKKGRVAYAVVNGQTGEAAADLPIDIKRFAIGSILLALPIIYLFNRLFVITPHVMLRLCMLLAVLFSIVANYMTTEILLKESCIDTKLLKTQELERKRQVDKFFTLVVGSIIIVMELPFIVGFIAVGFPGDHIVIPMVILAIFLGYLILDLKYLKKPKDIKNYEMDVYEKIWKKKCFIVAKPLAALSLVVPVLIANPVSDLIFYGSALICMGMICISIRDVISCHNILTTRKLPQLNRRGGDAHE